MKRLAVPSALLVGFLCGLLFRDAPVEAHTPPCADVPACVQCQSDLATCQSQRTELNRWRNASMDLRAGDDVDWPLAKRAWRFGKEGSAEVRATMVQGLKDLCTAHVNAGLISATVCSNAHERLHWLGRDVGVTDAEELP